MKCEEVRQDRGHTKFTRRSCFCNATLLKEEPIGWNEGYKRRVGEELRVCDQSDATGAAAMLTSAEVKHSFCAADGTLLSLTSVPPCRPWTAASENVSADWCRWACVCAFSVLVHGVVLLLLWGVKL